MRLHERWRAVIAAALAFGMASTGSALAAGWTLQEFETPLGDKGVALLVRAKRHPDVQLGIACDGDTGHRWRGVSVVQEADNKSGLGMRGDVRISFGEAWSRDLWAVRTTAAERRIFSTAEPTKLARRMLKAEAASPNAEMTVEIHGVSGKPVALTFPLAGLGAKIDQIAAKCDDWEIRDKE